MYSVTGIVETSRVRILWTPNLRSAFCFVLACLTFVAPQSSAGVISVPPPVEQRTALEKEVREYYAVDAAKSNIEKRSVLQVIVTAAKEELQQGSPKGSSYCALVVALQLAKDTFQIHKMQEVLELLEKYFVLDDPLFAAKHVKDYLRICKVKDCFEISWPGVIALAAHNAESGRFEVAAEILRSATAAATRLRSDHAKRKLVEMSSRVAQRKKARELYTFAVKHLNSGGTKPEAKFAAGFWLFVYEAKREEAQPYLAKCDQPKWRAAAELSAKASGLEDRIADADAWWRLLESMSGQRGSMDAVAAVRDHALEKYTLLKEEVPGGGSTGTITERLAKLHESQSAELAALTPDRLDSPTDLVATSIKLRELVTLAEHEREVNCLRFSPTEELLVSGGGEGAYISWDVKQLAYSRANRPWEADTSLIRVAPLDRKNNSDHIVAVDFDSSGQVFACSGVTHWGNGFGCNLAIFTPYRKEPYGIGCDCAWSWSCVAVEPRGRYVVMGSLHKQLRVASLLPVMGKDGKPGASLESRQAVVVPNEVLRIACHPERAEIAAGGRGGWLHLYEVRTSEVVSSPVKLAGHDDADIVGLAYTRDGTRLLSVAKDKTVRVWDLATGKQEVRTALTTAVPTWCDIHPAFPWVLVSSDDGKASIVNYQDGTLVTCFGSHTGAMLSAVFHPSGKWIATAGKDAKITLWEIEITAILP